MNTSLIYLARYALSRTRGSQREKDNKNSQRLRFNIQAEEAEKEEEEEAEESWGRLVQGLKRMRLLNTV